MAVPFEIDSSLPSSLVPLGWLVGRWEGAGVLASPEAGETQVGQEVEITADARGFLHHRSQVWRLDAQGERIEDLDSEVGYWRTARPQAAAPAISAPASSSPARLGVDVELLLTHPTGVVEVFVGRMSGRRAELVTDAVLATAGGPDYTAGQRIYGLVEGDLLWVQDVASSTEPLHARLSARLKPVT